MTVYQRFDPTKRYTRLLVHHDRVVQSAEANDEWAMNDYRLRGLMDILFKSGDLVSGAQCVTDIQAKLAKLEAGRLYVDAAVHPIEAAQLAIATEGNVYVGAYLQRDVVTHLQDPTLKNPAQGTRGWDEPGADRERITLVWGIKDDGTAGEFFPVWLIEDGNVRPKEPPPNIDAVTQALARYDEESTGSNYVSSGLQLVMGDDLATGEQIYTLKAGVARIRGLGLRLGADRRIVYATQPDVQWIDSEPHASLTAELQTINLDRWPAVGAVQARITVRRVVDVVHGGFIGAADPLPDNAVIEVEQVKQGATVYDSGASWNLVAGQIDWSPTGPEPAPGTTYQATYKCNIVADVLNQTTRTFQVQGALPGTQVLTSYNFALRRYDRLVLNTDGVPEWVRGVSSAFNPLKPRTPSNCLSIGTVYQPWTDERRVIDDRVRMVPMETQHRSLERMNKIEVDIATLSLAVDVSGRWAGVQKGRYADPMHDSSMRDLGVAQSGAIANRALQLPNVVTAYPLGLEITARTTVESQDVAAVSQPLRSGSMLVNPYSAFGVMPAQIELMPAVDRWTETTGAYISPTEEKFYQGSGVLARETSRDVVDVVVEQNSKALEFLRPISVEFLCHFGPGETLQSLTFAGLPVAAQPLAGGQLVADAAGLLRGKFTVPADIPAGTKDVEFKGSGGSYGTAQFTGQGTLIEQQLQQVTRIWLQKYDPLAQTFTLAQTRQATGIKLWATAVGGALQVQLREVENGYPSQRILAECVLKPEQVKTDGTPTIARWPSTLLEAGRDYCAVILATDATSALAIAELSKWDLTGQQWITSQPYTVGVLLSSSNASTWTAHQNMDLAFELLVAEYAGSPRTIELGHAEVVNATDLMVSAFAHEPAVGAGCTFELETTVGGQPVVHRVAAGQVKQLTERYTGSVTVRALLHCTRELAAALEPGITLLAGNLQTAGDYVSAWVNADATRPSSLRVVLSATLPGGSGVIVQCQAEGSSQWVSVPYLSTSHPTAGTLENTYQLDDVQAARVRVRLVMAGDLNARPLITDLRAVVLEV